MVKADIHAIYFTFHMQYNVASSICHQCQDCILSSHRKYFNFFRSVYLSQNASTPTVRNISPNATFCIYYINYRSQLIRNLRIVEVLGFTKLKIFQIFVSLKWSIRYVQFHDLFVDVTFRQ